MSKEFPKDLCNTAFSIDKQTYIVLRLTPYIYVCHKLKKGKFKFYCNVTAGSDWINFVSVKPTLFGQYDEHLMTIEEFKEYIIN